MKGEGERAMRLMTFFESNRTGLHTQKEEIKMEEQPRGPVFTPVCEADIDALWHIYLYYIRCSTATFQIRDITYDEMRMLLLPARKVDRCYTIRAGGEICGYASYSRYRPREAFGKTAEISIYLKKEFAGQGIGAQAVAWLEEDARRAGLHTLLALICHENEGSIRLFARRGFARRAMLPQVGLKFGRYLDLLVYQKILDAPQTQI